VSFKSFLSIGLISLAAFLITSFLSFFFIIFSSHIRIFDYPNARSLHNRVVPRNGGVAVLSGVFVGGLLLDIFLSVDFFRVFLLIMLPLMIVSFLDDLYDVHPIIRLLTHLFVAVSLIGEIEYSVITSFVGPFCGIFSIVAVLSVIWMINLYNFMDGMDGLAVGMAIVGFSSFAFLGFQAQDIFFFSLNLVIVSACFGFTLFNFPPAKIFLGDIGSTSLGFFVVVISLLGIQKGLFPLWGAMLIFSPFIIDATVTLLQRLFQGKKFWLPHNTHHYQRLVKIGWNQKKVLIVELLLMFACSLSTLLAVRASATIQIGVVFSWIIIYILLIRGLVYLERRRKLHAP
jgi:UDP-N-acetylmuramyl pentapeptide phosphotransferase/UDP-N-acetylglucosamine-1-phosphate transferase